MAPIGAVSGNSVNEFMVADILRGLIGVAPGDAGSADQREADGVVGRLVRSVFAVAENGGAVLAAHVSEIDPLVRGHFEFFRLGGGALEGADVPVISGDVIGGGK